MNFPRITVFAALSANLVLAAGTAQAQAKSAQAGVAAAVRGEVTLVAMTETSRAVGQNLTSGDNIYLGDMIETGPLSGMQIMLLDETVFTIGPEAALTIDTFVYDPATSAGQVTASVVKGAFRFVSGRVAKEEPRNMSVRTPVGTIGIRGTSAAGRVSPPDADGNVVANIVLLGPGVDNNATERAGRIIVSNGGQSVEISRSGFGTTISGLAGIPTTPIRFDPAQVGALTGGLGTNGGARPAQQPGTGRSANTPNGNDNTPANGPGAGSSRPGNTGGPAGQQAGSTPGQSTSPIRSAGGGTIGLGQVASLSGQNLGVGAAGANTIGEIDARQTQSNQVLLDAAENENNLVSTAIANFDQLRTIQTGTASFNFGTINLNHTSGPNTNSGGSYQAAVSIDFGARSLSLTVSNVSYFFNGGQGQQFVFNPDAGDDINGTYDNDSGSVADTWNSNTESDRFPTLPTDGSTAEVKAAILNNTDEGIIASHGRVSVTINNGTDVVSGSKTVPAQ